MIFLFLYLIISFYTSYLNGDDTTTTISTLRASARAHQPAEMNLARVGAAAKLVDETHFQQVLANILVPRVVGTVSHQRVKEFLITSMKDLGWNVTTDPFKAQTPRFGKLTFENIVARVNPNAKRYLALACHYDSKYFRERAFIGATDSAVPCAIMLNIAHVLKPYLDQIKNNDELSLKFIFFDGEEAFVSWGPDDSIYGAKHLARRWHNEEGRGGPGSTYLDSLDVLVLLDLLGAANPRFYSFFKNTERWYRLLADSEEALRQIGGLSLPRSRYFKYQSTLASIEDDHLPFLDKDVPILHIIPTPFPNVWHTEDDNENAIDWPTTRDLTSIIRLFVIQYLHLPVNDNK